MDCAESLVRKYVGIAHSFTNPISLTNYLRFWLYGGATGNIVIDLSDVTANEAYYILPETWNGWQQTKLNLSDFTIAPLPLPLVFPPPGPYTFDFTKVAMINFLFDSPTSSYKRWLDKVDTAI